MKAARSIATYVALLAAVFLFVVLTIEAAGIVLAAALGIIALGIAIARPKLFLLLAVLAMLIAPSIEKLSGLDVLSYIDEGAAVAAAIVAACYRLYGQQRLHAMPGSWFFLLWAVAGIVSSINHDVDLGFAMTSGFLFVKGPLFAFAFMQFDWSLDDIRRGAKIAAAVLIGVLALAAVNATMPSAWATALSTQGGVDVRYGIPSLIGPFTHPFAFGQFMALSFIAVFLYRAAVRKSPLTLILLIASGLGTFLSGRRKALASLVGGTLVARLFLPGHRAGWIIALVLAAPILLVVAFDQLIVVLADLGLQYIDQADTATRSIMYRDSVLIALRDFPFGAGWGRYGSFGALSNYSPEYIERGYHLIYGMQPDNALYMTDTFWPAIIGEGGVIGLIGYVGMLIALTAAAARVRGSSQPLRRWVGLVAIGWSVEFAIESVAAPVYSGPPLFALLFVVLGVAISLQRGEAVETVALSSATPQGARTRGRHQG